FGGEALEVGRLREWVERHGVERPELVNMYGITETTVHVSYRRLGLEEVREGGGSVIGVGLSDMGMYVVDEEQEMVGMGMSGELYVGGGGVARGYVGAKETAERLVPDGVSGKRGERLYRSGDVVRREESGELVYEGRRDWQV